LQFLYNAFKMSSVFERAKPHYLDVHLCQTHPYIGLPYRKIEQKPTGQHLPITLGQCLEDVLSTLCPSCYPSETVLLQSAYAWESGQSGPHTVSVIAQDRSCHRKNFVICKTLCYERDWLIYEELLMLHLGRELRIYEEPLNGFLKGRDQNRGEATPSHVGWRRPPRQPGFHYSSY
jgi:hypothetical protein